MRLGRLHAENFSSYAELYFDFRDRGLTLIAGATGAGKSALLDVAVWVLYGQTAKGGNADDIRSWQADGLTKATCEIELAGITIVVTRQRGKTNDLFWTESRDVAAPLHRGKDLADTQKRLEARLGVSADRFIAASYCHEFSPTGAFFTSKAKDRREVLEGLADLRLAEQVADGAKKLKSAARSEADEYKQRTGNLGGRLSATQQAYERTKQSDREWLVRHNNALAVLARKAEAFEEEKDKAIQALRTQKDAWEHERPREDEVLDDSWYAAKLATLKTEARCTKCGSLPAKANEEMLRVNTQRAANKELLRQQAQANPYASALKLAEARTNGYAEQLAEAKEETNPHTPNIAVYKAEVERLTAELSELKTRSHELQLRLSSLDQVQDLATQHRATMLHSTVQQIEDETNRYLEKYFDGAFRVGFVLADDALDVQIIKNGYACNYKQLSKGQRGLLRLCFVVAVMRATADSSGIEIRQVFLDEALDGLDAGLKVSAFRLFEELAQGYDSVFVVEHSVELQAMFATKYRVELVNDHSEITRES